jgi:hypothetical protein
VLRSFRGHVRARPVAVFEALAERLRPATDARCYFTADATASLIIVQGGWWYRAEYRIVPDDTGSRVEQTLLNVAERARWAGPLIGRKKVATAPSGFDRLLKELRESLE